MLKFFSSLRDTFPINRIMDFLDRIIIESIRYGRGRRYDARQYWSERFSKFGLSLKASGNRRISEEANRRLYDAAKKAFIKICDKAGIEFSRLRVLDIGCGTGVYTRLFYEYGVKDYVGLDITDVLFPRLKEQFSEYRFIKKDITTGSLSGTFDLIIMIEVIEHIVDKDKLVFCLENIMSCLSEDGWFIVAPIFDVSKRALSYVRYWSLDDIKPLLSGCTIKASEPFTTGRIIAVTKGRG